MSSVPATASPWARARYFLVQSCAVSVVLGAHPRLHFPMDAVIGVTREAVPKEHPLRLVVEAHAWLHLPLNYGVTYNERSVAHNHQREIYTPFPVRRDDVFQRILSPYYRGVEGNSAFPAYRYPMAAPSFPGPYAEFLRRYYDVVLAFCRRVVAEFDEGDDAVLAWGEALHQALPGFPAPADLADEDVLARALAGFVHTVAVWHSADHHTYGEWPVNQVPQRLRVPPPTGGDEAVPLHRWVSRVDLARQELARRLFYQAPYRPRDPRGRLRVHRRTAAGCGDGVSQRAARLRPHAAHSVHAGGRDRLQLAVLSRSAFARLAADELSLTPSSRRGARESGL